MAEQPLPDLQAVKETAFAVYLALGPGDHYDSAEYRAYIAAWVAYEDADLAATAQAQER